MTLTKEVMVDVTIASKVKSKFTKVIILIGILEIIARVIIIATLKVTVKVTFWSICCLVNNLLSCSGEGAPAFFVNGTQFSAAQ